MASSDCWWRKSTIEIPSAKILWTSIEWERFHQRKGKVRAVLLLDAGGYTAQRRRPDKRLDLLVCAYGRCNKLNIKMKCCSRWWSVPTARLGCRRTGPSGGGYKCPKSRRIPGLDWNGIRIAEAQRTAFNNSNCAELKHFIICLLPWETSTHTHKKNDWFGGIPFAKPFNLVGDTK